MKVVIKLIYHACCNNEAELMIIAKLSCKV